MIEDLCEEIKCSICVMDFAVPVTIHCGHTFCRECLTRAPNKECPLCRKQILINVQHLQQNITITEIIESINKLKGKEDGIDIDNIQNNGKCIINKVYMEKMLLFITNSRALMLPYSKNKITFRSNSLTLPETLKNIIIKHGSHQNTYSLLGNLSNITPHPEIIFEFQAIFCPINFFEVKSVHMVETGGEDQQFCEGLALIEKTSIPLSSFSNFFRIYDKLNDQYKQLISQMVDSIALGYRNDPVAIMYIIYQLMLTSNAQKMEILNTFDDQIRAEKITKYFEGLDLQTVIRSPATVFTLRINGNYSSTYVFVVIFILLIMWKLSV